MTDEERAVIEAAEKCPNVLHWPQGGGYYETPSEYATLIIAVRNLRESRKPKPRYVTRPTGFGEAVWDRERETFVPPHECAEWMNKG